MQNETKVMLTREGRFHCEYHRAKYDVVKLEAQLKRRKSTLNWYAKRLNKPRYGATQ